MKTILFGAMALFLMASCGGNKDSETGAEGYNPTADSIVQEEAIRQAQEAAQEAREQERLDSIREDSLKIVDKFNEALLKPSDVFIKAHNDGNPIKEPQIIAKLLDSKGYKLISKKLNFTVETDWGGDMKASYWKYKLEVENPYSDKTYSCEVYIGDVYGNALEITFNDEKEALDFVKNSSPYIQNRRGNTYELSDYDGMERKGKKIIVFKTGE